MKNHFILNDKTFETQFENATLYPELFTHEAHLRLAWIHIYKYGVEEAIINVSTQLINYTTSLGEQGKYNETVTIAAVKAVYHFMLKSKSDNFKDFIEEFPRLNLNFKDLLSQHYKIDVFNSEIAKSSFLEPDLLPFN